VAIIVVVPDDTAVAKPPGLLIVATVGVEEFHVAVAFTFCVLPSEYVPVAVNCCVPPTAMDALAGVTAMLIRLGAPVTVNSAVPVMEPEVAVIVDAPTAAPVANPPVVIIAVVVVPELHVTLEVIFCVLPLL
jgi:hypothetical protein